MSEKYILNAAGEPEPCDDLLTWGHWMNDVDRRRVGYTAFEGGYVSTVFLGLDHRFDHGEPVLWETMIIGGPHDSFQDRYTSLDAAVRGHQRAVEMATAVGAK
jgi:hypothetical protein